jgi:MFS superfamily sulfate permease-like transporter
MNPTTAKIETKDDNALIGWAAAACVVTGIIFSPIIGIGVGVVVASIGLALRKRRPTVKEVVKVIAALVAVSVLLALLRNWGDFKEGIVDGYNRARRS